MRRGGGGVKSCRVEGLGGRAVAPAACSHIVECTAKQTGSILRVGGKCTGRTSTSAARKKNRRCDDAALHPW